MMGAANGLDTTRSDGTPLRFRGITFEGTPRAIFWSGFFEPFMVDAARQSIQWVLDECRSRELDHGPYVLEVRALIRLLVDRAYEDMASTDQLLLGNGDPTSVARVNVADQITTMQSHVDELVAALQGQSREARLGQSAEGRRGRS
jgi:hypothetical protein